MSGKQSRRNVTGKFAASISASGIAVLLLVATAAGTVSSDAMAFADREVIEDGKKILVTDITTKGDDKLIKSSALANGIFINVPMYPNLTKLMRQRIKAAGFKVVGNAIGSSIAVTFMSTVGDLNLKNAEANTVHTGSISGESVSATVGAVIGGGLAGGISSVASLFGGSSKGLLSGTVIVVPDDKDGISSSIDKSLFFNKGRFNNILLMKYKVDKDEGQKATELQVFEMFADEFIKQYFVLDTPRDQAADAESSGDAAISGVLATPPASAVPVAQPETKP